MRGRAVFKRLLRRRVDSVARRQRDLPEAPEPGMSVARASGERLGFLRAAKHEVSNRVKAR
jgi:hypothetical protein